MGPATAKLVVVSKEEADEERVGASWASLHTLCRGSGLYNTLGRAKEDGKKRGPSLCRLALQVRDRH